MTSEVLRPRALRPGDRVAVLAPAGPLADSGRRDLDRGLALLESWGFRPRLMPHALTRRGYLAGDDAERSADLQAAFADPELRAIFCVRGGYGVTRILPRLDFAPLRKDPKPLVGFSDVTALLAAAFERIGLIGFHGPMVATSESMAMGRAMAGLQRTLLTDRRAPTALPVARIGSSPHVLVAGRREARLVGGNLTLVCALIGTPWQIRTAGRALFLEDVGEAPYRVDRMLTQLRTAGLLDEVAAVLVGDFHQTDTPVASLQPEMARVLEERLGDLGCPVLVGLPFGHRPESWTLPVGVRAAIDAEDPGAVPKIRLLEPATA